MPTIGMIGVGNMGSAIAKAILKAGYPMILHNRTKEKLHAFIDELDADVQAIDSLKDLILNSDIIYIGVKPQQFKQLFQDLSEFISSSQPKVWVSMAAGLSLEQVTKLTPSSHHWIRIMPNTPVEIGQGYIAYCHTSAIKQEILQMFEESLVEAGIVEKIDESLFNAVTGLAGSGPAFIYQLIEAMSDVGVKYGLSREMSHKMAAQTVKGAASVVIETGQHPGELKDKVTSPAGTTIEGIVALEHAGFKSAINQGVSAAIEKSIQMEKKK
ncbi:pyrroline-5-carboxylate reductase [Aerococcaceae bacterium WGS1372]